MGLSGAVMGNMADINGLYWGCMGIMGLYWGYMGIMEGKMESAIMRLYRV